MKGCSVSGGCFLLCFHQKHGKQSKKRSVADKCHALLRTLLACFQRNLYNMSECLVFVWLSSINLWSQVVASCGFKTSIWSFSLNLHYPVFFGYVEALFRDLLIRSHFYKGIKLLEKHNNLTVIVGLASPLFYSKILWASLECMSWACLRGNMLLFPLPCSLL